MSAARDHARDLAATLRAAGFTAWFAGGCVRDALLGREPKDYDIATDARPKQVTALFPCARQVGAHFGVVLVPTPSGGIEVATFRTDGCYRDGRHPESVRFATATEDAHRRDFTINGMFQDPESGAIIDKVGGRGDLDRRILRAIGDPAARFAEDHLRVLRALRFATELPGFTLEPTTWQALRSSASAVARVAPERIQTELDRILSHPHRVAGFDLLIDSGVMAVVLPEIMDLRGCDQPPQFHPEGDVFVHTRLMLGMLAPDAPIDLVWATLLHDIGKPATRTIDADGRIRFHGHDRVGAALAESILRRLRYPNERIDRITEMVRQHMNTMHVQAMRVATLKRFMARPTFPLELELHRIDCASSNGLLDNYEFLVGKQREFSQAPLIPSRLLTGRDLLAHGLSGPVIGTLLAELQTLQMEGQLTNRDDALAWLEEKCRDPNPPPATGGA